MEILWIAIIFYSAGLALVLHLRPALMFNEDGTWKEFGYQRSSRHTLLPVWLFVIVWAFMSYTLAAAIFWLWSSNSSAVAMAVPLAAAQMYDEEDAEEEEQESVPMTTVSAQKRGPGRPRKENAKPREGYYVLENNGDGLNRYIYYGAEAPPMLSKPSQDTLLQ